MSRIRVLVVEDSLTVRKRLVEILNDDPELEVVGEAADGKTCIEMCRRLRPDVLTLDMVLPVLSGLAATEYIMAYFPTPILIVSASANRGEVFKTYDALAAGALDVLEKPKADSTDVDWENRLVFKVKLISRIKPITHLKGRRRDGRARPAPPAPPRRSPGYRLVAIGTSTGGPAAVVEILKNLPGDFPLPVLLVIHIDEMFARHLAEWIESQSVLPVRYAMDREALPGVGHGLVLMAPPNRHLVVAGGRLSLNGTAERHSCRPSIDTLFESLAVEFGKQSIACLLTGMGKDGAAGLLAIRNAGGLTLAQDEATSVVFGMPAEAVKLNAAERVLGVHEFAPALAALAGVGNEVGVRARP
ncbi:MAG TPA: chemotaxis-specific protein-glutamate methyltransferase CheB [Terriglobales bacterium]|nr:chemotaxis-specific protein-glutamate methyltransferase CheB [Terriglobales bacterium]